MPEHSPPVDLTEKIALTVLDQYRILPSKGKPRTRTNGAMEWTVLSGFVIYDSSDPTKNDYRMQCVSIGSGVKVLPHSKLSRHGDVLHDSHSEVISRRGLLRFLMSELGEAMKGGTDPCLAKDSLGRWKLRDELRLAMYISTLPCGDASMYSLALRAPPSPPLDDAALPCDRRGIETLAPSSSAIAASLGMNTFRDDSHTDSDILQVRRGRVGYTAAPGTLRTKPGRLDSQPSTSHSCSDKIAMWSLVGSQGGILAALGMDKIVISDLVIGGVERNERERVKEEVERAVNGRLGDWHYHDWRSVPPEVTFCDVRFEKDRDFVDETPGTETVSAAESFSYILGQGVEVTCNGTRLGGKMKRQDGEGLGPSIRSRISKLGLLQYCAELSLFDEVQKSATYHDIKHSSFASRYQKVKTAVRSPGAPLAAWLVTGQEFEAFDRFGRLIANPKRCV